MQNDGENGIIQEERYNPNHDEKGRFTSGNGGAKMSAREKHFVSSAIHTNHPEYKAGSSQVFEYGDYFYKFKVIEPGKYDFDIKLKLCSHNRKLINEFRRWYKDE